MIAPLTLSPSHQEHSLSLRDLKTEENRQWYAVYTKSRCEKKMDAALRRMNYESFLPLVKEKRKWSDRVKTVEVPLLPGYIFVHLSLRQIPEIYHFSWMVNFVQHEGKPAIIRDDEITVLAQIISNNYAVKPTCKTEEGDYVVIQKGPFKGSRGRVEKVVNGYKVLLALESINQQLCVELKMHDLTNA